MIQQHRCVALAGLILSLLPGLVASPARADDAKAQIATTTYRAFANQADLERWLKKEMIPGQTSLKDVTAVLGWNYLHYPPFGRSSTFYYKLDSLGVRDHKPDHFLFVEFDDKSGKLLCSGVGEMERQTGFIREQSGQ